KIQHKRGLEANLPQLDVAEIAFTTDSKKPFIGSADGNVEIAKKADVDAKASKTELTNAVSPKADKTYVDTELGKKASTDEVSALSTQLADTAEETFYTAVTPTRKRKPIISFVDDDGNIAVMEKLKPILEEYDIPITFAIITSRVGNTGNFPPTITMEQLKELERLGGEFVSHTHTHPHLADQTPEVVEEELSKSREWLLKQGYNADSLVYPFGSVDAEVM